MGRVRILIDYRPALRERTGVGEYAHELARALVAPARPPGDSLVALLQLLEGSAAAGARFPACRSSTRASRSRSSTSPGIGSSGRRSRRFAGDGRRRALAASAADAGPARRAGGHDSRSRLPGRPGAHRAPKSGATTRRSPARTPGARTPSSPSRTSRRGEVRARLGVPATASSICPPGAPAGRRATRRAARRLHPVLRHARAAQERRGAASRLRRRCVARTARRAAARARGRRRRRRASRGSTRLIAAPPLAGHVRHVGYVSGRRARAPLSTRRRCWCCRRSTKASASRCSKR